MGWATAYIERLRAGETVRFRPRGHSMQGRIRSGQLCTVGEQRLKKGDIVLCEVGRAQYLHLIGAVQGSRYQIRNNHGRINGWIHRSRIHGKLVAVE